MKRLNPRQEAFCQSFVRLGNAAYAAREAGYSPPSSRKQGYRLVRDPRIIARIAEIRLEWGRAQARDRDILIGKLEYAYNQALEQHHTLAAVRAVEAQAKLSGFMPAARRSDGPRPQPPLPEASPTAPDMRTNADIGMYSGIGNANKTIS